jgi:hypothetical protein
MSLTPKLEQRLVIVPDLGKQPKSSHLLIIGTQAGQKYYAIDEYTHDYLTGVSSFTRREDGRTVLVYQCRTKEAAWAVVDRSTVSEISEEEYIRFQKTDGEAVEVKMKELNPEGWAQAEEFLESQGIIMRKKDSGKEEKMPGNYL